MLYFVYVDNVFIGTVVASSEVEALELAEKKFPVWGLFTVKPRL